MQKQINFLRVIVKQLFSYAIFSDSKKKLICLERIQFCPNPRVRVTVWIKSWILSILSIIELYRIIFIHVQAGALLEVGVIVLLL